MGIIGNKGELKMLDKMVYTISVPREERKK